MIFISEELVENQTELTAIEKALAKAERTRKRYKEQVCISCLEVNFKIRSTVLQ